MKLRSLEQMSPVAKSAIRSVDLDLLHHIYKPAEARQSLVNALAKNVVRPVNQANPEVAGLTGTILSAFFADDLTAGYLEGIRRTLLDTSENPIISSLQNNIQELNARSTHYFQQPEDSFDFWLPKERLSNEVAQTILDAKVEHSAHQLQAGFNNPNQIADAFYTEQQNVWGLWMSAEGVSFDKNKLPQKTSSS